MSDRYNLLSPNEVNQSFVRTSNTILVNVYLLIYAYFDTNTIVNSYTLIAFIYLILTAPL